MTGCSLLDWALHRPGGRLVKQQVDDDGLFARGVLGRRGAGILHLHR
jgi:hypothetical protein